MKDERSTESSIADELDDPDVDFFCLLPVFILGLQAFLNPSQLLFLVNDPAGRIVAGCALACMLAGFIIIQRMSRSLNG